MGLGRLRRTTSWLALVLAITFVMPGFVGCADNAAKIRVHQRRGDRYLEEGKLSEAILEYKNVLQIDPNHPEAHWGLARAYLGDKQFSRAYWELQETARLAPHNLDATLQLGQFLLYGEEEELLEALGHAEKILEADDTRSKAWLLKARSLESLERFAEAQEAYEKAVEVEPGDAPLVLQLANFYNSRGQAKKAEPLYRQLGELSPGFAAYAALAGFLASQPGREDEAEAAYRESLELAEPENRVRAYSMLANFYYAKQRFDDAESTLIAGLESEEDSLDLIYALARFYHSRGQVEKADAMIEESTKAKPGDPGPYMVLSAYRGRQGDLDGALQAADQAVDVAPTDNRARLRRAEVLVDMGYRRNQPDLIAEGSAAVDAVLAKDPGNPEALFVKSKIDLANQRVDEAVGSLRHALDARPGWAQAHFLLASALFLRDDASGARAEAVRALELDANLLDAQRLLARINARLGEDDLAVEIAQRVLAKDPSDFQLRILMAQSLVHLNRIEEAIAQLESIPDENRDGEAHYAVGRLQYLNSDLEGARKNFTIANEMEPNRYEILRALMDIDLREDRIRDSADRIRDAVRAEPDDARLAQLNGELSLYLGRSAEAGKSFQRAIELDPNDLRGYEQLARYLLLTGQPEEVVQTYEQALQSNPESGSLHLILGSLYETQLRYPDAIARYEEALRLDPTLAVAKNNLAYLLAETGGSLERALDLAQEAKELLPDNPNTADTLGWVLYKKKIPSAAIGYLQEAERGLSRDNPQLGLVRHHLALAYEAAGQPDRARDVIERALRDLEAMQREGGAEPAWAGELRTMRDRLPPAEEVAASQEG